MRPVIQFLPACREGSQDPPAGVLLLNKPSARAGGMAALQGRLQESLEEGLLHSQGLRALLLKVWQEQGESVYMCTNGLIPLSSNA